MRDEDEDENENEDERGESQCPFCSAVAGCPHLLLLADKTFRTAEGGLLREAFNARWSRACLKIEASPELSEGDAFAKLLSEVELHADAFDEYDFEAGPGTSSTYAVYYVSSVSRREKILASFGNAVD